MKFSWKRTRILTFLLLDFLKIDSITFVDRSFLLQFIAYYIFRESCIVQNNMSFWMKPPYDFFFQ